MSHSASPGKLRPQTDTDREAVVQKLKAYITQNKRPPNARRPKRNHDVDGRQLPFMDRGNLNLELWKRFEVEQRQISENVLDRTRWPVWAVVGTPGSGKTRFIAEVLSTPHETVAQHFTHYVHIHATYNDGNEIKWRDREDPARALSVKLLYHHFIEGGDLNDAATDEMYLAVRNCVNFNLSDALTIIRDEFIMTNNLSPDTVVNIAVGVDEYSKWLAEPNSSEALKKIIESLASTRIGPPSGVNFFYVFAGTSHAAVKEATSSSSFKVVSHRLSPLSVASTLAVAQDVLLNPAVHTDACLRGLLLDIEGHPRLLEKCLRQIKLYGDKLDCVDWSKVSSVLADEVAGLWGLPSFIGELQPIIVDMIKRNKVTPGTKAGLLTYDRLEQLELGLRYDHGVPYVPYLCLQAWATGSGFPKSPLMLQLKATINSSNNNQFYTWQHFEVFCAQYMALRIAAWAPEGKVALSQLLAGALLADDLDQNLIIQAPGHRKDVRRATKRFPKKTKIFDSDAKKISWKCSGEVVLNAEGAPFDFFVSLDNETENGFVICGQTKYYKLEKLTQRMVDDEYAKVQKAMKKAKIQHWLLLVLITGQFDEIEVPRQCAMVAMPQFEAFFGRPFAERVYFWCTETVNINTAPEWALRRVPGLGQRKAWIILKERSKRPFADKNDIRDRLKLENSKLTEELLSVITV